jgi:histone H3/H4
MRIGTVDARNPFDPTSLCMAGVQVSRPSHFAAPSAEVPLPAIPVPDARAGKRKSMADSPQLYLPRTTFRRLILEIMGDLNSDLRVSQGALTALQEDAELLLTERFKRCSRLAEFCRRDTVRQADWQFMGEDEGSLAQPYSGRS